MSAPSINVPIERQNISFKVLVGVANFGRAFARVIFRGALFLVGFGLVWQIAHFVMVDWQQIWVPALFPSPLEVAGAIVDHVADGSLPRATVSSLARLFVGFGLSLPIGVLLALGLSRNKILRAALGPVVLGFQALPSICWLPLAILWFGLNESAIIFVIVMGSVFSITIATYDGTKAISPLLLLAARNMGVKGQALFWRVILPASLPAVLSGTRQGWSFAWRSLLAGELLTFGQGLGNLLNQGRDLTDMPLVMAVMVVIVVLGLAVDQAFLTTAEHAVQRRYGLVGEA